MSAQTTYGFSTPIGAAGGIVDLAPYAVDAFLNEEATGTLKFGVGVVKGTTAGTGVKLPVSNSVAADFEGIVTNRRTCEYDLEGDVNIRNKAGIGIMRYGRIYGRIATDVNVAYGDKVYMLISGDQKGYFTNAAANAVAVNGRFLGTKDSSTEVAEIELFNGPASDADYSLPTASSTVLGGVKVGTGLTMTDGVLSVTQANEG